MNWKISNKENIYRNICIAITILTYLLLFVCTLGIILVYVLIFWLCMLCTQAMMLAQLKQNSVRININQMPNLYQTVQEYCNKLGMAYPEIYLVESGGILNAFATRYLSRDFVIINSEVLNSVNSENEDAVKFILAHELAHIKRKHVSIIWTLVGKITPFLGTAYSRACETTCDNIATQLVGEKAIEGLLLLIAGASSYKKINLIEIMHQSNDVNCFWSWLSEIFSTHPHLVNRIKNVEAIKNSLIKE